MDEYPVKLGSMLFTMVDPDRGHEVAFNRWYERDHFYAGCMIGPWLFAGRRFVATRAMKDLRFPATSPFAEPVDAGSYLAVYWMHEGHVEEHLKWAYHQVRALYAENRGFAERVHAHTNIYDLMETTYADPDGVPIELALDHGYGGLAVTVVEPADREGAVASLAAGPIAATLAAGAASCCSQWGVRASARAGSASVPMSLGSSGGSDDRIVQLWFGEGHPAHHWDAFRLYAADVESSGAGRVTFAAPFLPTNVGTDHYTDQLW